MAEPISPRPEIISVELSRREILSIIFRHLKVVLSLFIGIVAAAIFLTVFFLSPTYEAKTSILLNISDVIVPLADAPPLSDFEKLTFFHNQKNIIKSVTVLSKVVDRLDLSENRVIGNFEKLKLKLKKFKIKLGHYFSIKSWQKPIDFRGLCISSLIKNISIETQPETAIVKISYRCKNPAEASATLHALIDEFKLYFNNSLRARASGLTDYLETKLVEVSADLKEKEDAMLRFKLSHTLVMGKKISNEIDVKQDDPPPSLIGIIDSSKVQNELKLYILSMENELYTIETDMSFNHPKAITLRKKIKEYVSMINSIPERELKFLRLRRSFEITQKTYLKLEENLMSTRIAKAGQTYKINIISVVDKAVTNTTPIAPKPKLTILAALIFGSLFSIVCAIVLDHLDHRIKSPKEIEQHLGLKVLGSIPKQ